MSEYLVTNRKLRESIGPFSSGKSSSPITPQKFFRNHKGDVLFIGSTRDGKEVADVNQLLPKGRVAYGMDPTPGFPSSDFATKRRFLAKWAYGDMMGDIDEGLCYMQPSDAQLVGIPISRPNIHELATNRIRRDMAMENLDGRVDPKSLGPLTDVLNHPSLTKTTRSLLENTEVLSPYMASKTQQARIDGIRSLVGDRIIPVLVQDSIPLSRNSIQTAYDLFAGIQYIRNPDELFRYGQNVNRVMAPGGQLNITVGPEIELLKPQRLADIFQVQPDKIKVWKGGPFTHAQVGF